ncbi:tyrosine-type recombinase/integrase [Flavobacterium sp.]|uniref:tyrosine-type recombinase/integrase n=1 Tax=Flavobacterium sp. TaxID=239 RepID=UPI00374D4923
MASIKLILRKHQADQTGHSPLYIRIIKDRKTKFITAGVKLKENEWDEAKQKVKKNHPNSARMNASLSQKIADAEAQVADMERKVKTVSISKLKDAIKGKEVPNFFDYAYKRCEKLKGNLAFSTHRSYLIYTKKFENYLGTRDVYFDDITVSVLLDYISHLSNVMKNGVSTQRYSIMILAIMFKEAIKEDIIPEYMYPFSKLTLTKSKSVRTFLKKDQIEELLNKNLKSGTSLELARDMFVFSIYAGGLRFGDVIELQYKHFNEEENRIIKQIRKTGREHQFKIGKVAIDILNKYKKENPEPNDFIFPIIKHKEGYFKNEEFRYKVTENANRVCNIHLNRLGKEMKLPVPLTFHMSRHSFATNALNNGMRIEHVSKLMGHQDISTTQIYAKIISEELDKAVDKYIF